MNDQQPTPLTQNLCFTPGALIQTADGPVAVEKLSPGTLVLTRDDGLQPVRWIGRSTLDRKRLATSPHLRPIRLEPGALAPGLPARALVLSPHHRVMVRGPIAVRMFDSAEVLAAVKDLTACPGIAPAVEVTSIDYIHLMFDRHQLILAEGAVVESLYAGPQALRGMDAAALAELHALFPELRDALKTGHTPQSARPLLGGRQARALSRRHVKNSKPLVCA